MTHWLLKELDSTHTSRLAELEAQLFPGENPWSQEAFEAEIAQPHTFYVGVCAEHDQEKILGYAGLAVLGPQQDPECEIHTIGVDPLYQGQGLGRLLLENMVVVADSLAAPIFLEVRTDNIPAIRLYESVGFRKLGIRKNYYQPSGADAYTMQRPRSDETHPSAKRK